MLLSNINPPHMLLSNSDLLVCCLVTQICSQCWRISSCPLIMILVDGFILWHCLCITICCWKLLKCNFVSIGIGICLFVSAVCHFSYLVNWKPSDVDWVKGERVRLAVVAARLGRPLFRTDQMPWGYKEQGLCHAGHEEHAFSDWMMIFVSLTLVTSNRRLRRNSSTS